MKRYKPWFKLLAIFLSVLIGFQVAPVFAVALENDQSTTATTKKVSPKTSSTKKAKEVSDDVLLALADEDDANEQEDVETQEIAGEETDLRDASVKHFRLADGRYMAAVYPEPVHYEKDGEWVPIDNTLTKETKEDGFVYYVSKETSTPVSFPATITEVGESATSSEAIASSDNSSASGNDISVTVRGHDFKLHVDSASEDAKSAKVVDTEDLTSAKLDELATAAPSDSMIESGVAKRMKVNKNGEFKEELTESSDTAYVDNNDSAIAYKNAFSDADLEYKVTSSQIKESIVVKEAQDEYVYSFSFDSNGLDVIQNGDGSISLFEDGDEEHPLFVLQAPYMVDANGEESEDVTMTVEKSAGSNTQYSLTVEADSAWLNDSSRAFPVIIDPTVLLDVGHLNIDDTYVDTASAVHHAWAASLYVGKNSLGTTRTYIKYALPDLPDCSVVVGSKLYLAQRDYDPGSGTKAYVAAYSPKAAWTNTTLLWSNQPSYDSTYGAVDYTTFTAGTGSFNYTLDITKIAKQWYETGVNYGVMLKSYNESVTRRSAFYSTNYTSASMYPQITLTYVNSTGLESYWNYETVDLGRSGTVNVNDYNGALTYIHDDLSLSGNTLPLSMSHIYLSDVGSLNEFSDLQTTRYGTGFRTSLMERIKLLSSSTDSDLYTAGYRVKLTDVDGTVHYFKKTDTAKEYVYEFDENVIINEAPADDYIFTLSYDDGSKRLYDSEGYIVGMLDQNNQRYTIAPAQNNQMTITDGANRTATLTFNSSGYLTTLTDPAGRNTTYTYNNSNQLTQITYPDSKTTSYSYDSSTGLLTGITATDGSTITFTYKSVTSKAKTFYRVASMTRNGTESTYNSLSFDYDCDRTVVTSQDGTINKIGFDSMGRAVSVQDQDGNLVTGKYNNGGNKQNTVASSSNSFALTENFFLNHSFEDDFSNWNCYATNSSGSMSLSTDTVKAGNKSAKIIRTASGGSYLNQDYIDVTEGESYVASGYMKIDGEIENGTAFIKTEIKSGDTILSTESSIPYYTTQDEWQRVQVPVTIPSGCDRIRIFASIETYGSETETVYFDCMQLENEDAAGPYNFLTNPTCDMLDDTNNSLGWTLPTGGSTVSITSTDKGLRITGAPSSSRNAYQTITMNGEEGAVLVFGGLALGYASAQCNDTENNSRRFGLKLYLYNDDTLVTSKSLWFNAYTNERQSISGSIKATGSFNKVIFRCLYNQEVNAAAFDDLYVYEDSYGTNYSYNSDGQLVLQKSDTGDAIRYSYNGPDITKIAFEKNGTEKDNETYTYDNNHNLLTSTTKDGIVTSYTYPSPNRGMPSKIEVTDSSGNLSSKVEYTYTAYDNYLATTTDENGETTTYNYNTTKGLLDSVTDPLGNTTSYSYNLYNDNPLSTTGSIDNSNNATVNYGYDSQGRITSISPAGTTYGFTYDQFGRVTGTSVAGNTLSTVSYNSTGTVATSTYGNGTVHSYTYDSMDRVETESYDGTTAYRYAYNSQGYLGAVEDVAEDEIWVYGYDLAGRLTEEDSTSRISIRYGYNDMNNTSSYKVYKRGTKVSSADYTYSDVGLLTGVSTNNGNPAFSYSYDGLNRITKESHVVGTNTASTNYTYHSSAQGQSGRVASLTYQLTPDNGSESTLRNGISYEYNANGQITSITENNKTNSYVYDGLGRLVRENDEDRNVTICYNYDSNGNILSKVEYPYSTGALGNVSGTKTYTYSGSWGDQLLTYNGGSTITYDQIGNPLSYNGYTFTWQKGRQLATANDGTNSYSFIYNADGLRTWKTKNNSSTQYIYASGLLVYQTDGTNTLTFTYDPDGIALGVNLNGTDYYYLYNAQGDVIALYDSTGAIVTEYVYDSWGKLLSTTGSAASTIGTLNPLRYRGYFYDTDLGFYLLETRYYDPETGRFINADGVVDCRGIETANIFSYCANDPVNNKDEDGKGVVGALISGAINAGLSALTAKSKGQDRKTIAKKAAIGFAVGFVTGFISGGLSSINKAYKLGVLAKTLIVAGKSITGGIGSGIQNNLNRRVDAKAISQKKSTTKKSKTNNKIGNTSSSKTSSTVRYSTNQSSTKTSSTKVTWNMSDTKAVILGATTTALTGGFEIWVSNVADDSTNLRELINYAAVRNTRDNMVDILTNSISGVAQFAADIALYPGE